MVAAKKYKVVYIDADKKKRTKTFDHYIRCRDFAKGIKKEPGYKLVSENCG